ncbi:hypothetical protein SK854_13795 [Lentzea sp. BCCO 10_0061]|uniref:Uncharacterized protein n=1 Tax=Lentzea sokolovensis TaxID=3095429 RepID=A0ABU4UWY1_9PSEU|nr:hypothetical protein [Lentzea sp. BCCO 10_0061]MDX8143195.1 hypothetical protein [Lentzea sp. BCCO 10_0061]
MNGTASCSHGARGRLVRLAVVLAVLAGLALVVGVQCTDGMSMPHGANAVMADDGHELSVERPVAAGMSVAPDQDTHGDSDVGGALAACLMLIAAVIALVARLGLPRVRSSAVAAARSARTALFPVVLARAPSLERLCLLRI